MAIPPPASIASPTHTIPTVISVWISAVFADESNLLAIRSGTLPVLTATEIVKFLAFPLPLSISVEFAVETTHVLVVMAILLLLVQVRHLSSMLAESAVETTSLALIVLESLRARRCWIFAVSADLPTPLLLDRHAEVAPETTLFTLQARFSTPILPKTTSAESAEETTALVWAVMAFATADGLSTSATSVRLRMPH